MFEYAFENKYSPKFTHKKHKQIPQNIILTFHSAFEML